MNESKVMGGGFFLMVSESMFLILHFSHKEKVDFGEVGLFSYLLVPFSCYRLMRRILPFTPDWLCYQGNSVTSQHCPSGSARVLREELWLVMVRLSVRTAYAQSMLSHYARRLFSLRTKNNFFRNRNGLIRYRKSPSAGLHLVNFVSHKYEVLDIINDA
ncbi:hypothetical protein GIX45_19405 [Erwinia sp. CPCC 100877]|nr:hypothetical protein [Erwinia sp. CPCC 100877]